MRKIFLLLLLVFNLTIVFAQDPGYVDSLKHELAIREQGDSAYSAQIKLLIYLTYYETDAEQKTDYLNRTISLAQKHNNKQYEAWGYAYLASEFLNKGNPEKCIELSIKSANLYRELGHIRDEAHALHTIGSTFQKLGDLKNSITYLNQSLNIFRNENDSVYIAGTLLNIGESYRVANYPDSALFYFSEAKCIMDSILSSNYQQDKIIHQNRYTAIGNIGMVQHSQGNLKKAKKNLTLAIEYFSQVQDVYRKSVYQFELGKINISEGKTQLGEQLINHSYDLAKIANLKDQIRDFSHDLSSFYEKQGNSRKALQYYKTYKTYYDSIQNLENVRNLEQQQSKFQLTKKEEEITSLNQLNKIQTRLNIVFLAGILLFVAFVTYLFISNRKIKITNEELAKQKKLVEKREEEKALLLKELNHRVKNNLQMVASLLNLHARQLKGHPAAEALLAGRYRVEALTLIHQKLYRDDIDTKIDIKDYIEELARNLIMNFGQQFELQLNLISIPTKIDKAIPLGLILNELLTNSLKYGQNSNSPVLSIKTNNDSDYIHIFIQDNGPGLPENFNIAQSDSFGLKLVQSLIKQLGGKISWNSNSGTSWQIKVLYSKLI